MIFISRAIFGVITSGKRFYQDGNGHETVGCKRWGIAKIVVLVAIKVFHSNENSTISGFNWKNKWYKESEEWLL